MLERKFTGAIADMAYNREGLYEGDLVHYVQAIFAAPNIHHGYHGLRHMLHVTWVCYQACKYYGLLGAMDPRDMRNLLIAALFHDYDHAGAPGDDAENIGNAIRGLRRHMLQKDASHDHWIVRMIEATKFPHANLDDASRLGEWVIRDADISQAFGTTWVGDIAAGFGSELGKSPAEMLEQQLGFLKGLRFYTDFGKIFYGDEAIEAKRKETEDLLEILRR